MMATTEMVVTVAGSDGERAAYASLDPIEYHGVLRDLIENGYQPLAEALALEHERQDCCRGQGTAFCDH